MQVFDKYEAYQDAVIRSAISINTGLSHAASLVREKRALQTEVQQLKEKVSFLEETGVELEEKINLLEAKVEGKEALIRKFYKERDNKIEELRETKRRLDEALTQLASHN